MRSPGLLVVGVGMEIIYSIQKLLTPPCFDTLVWLGLLEIYLLSRLLYSCHFSVLRCNLRPVKHCFLSGKVRCWLMIFQQARSAQQQKPKYRRKPWSEKTKMKPLLTLLQDVLFIIMFDLHCHKMVMILFQK